MVITEESKKESMEERILSKAMIRKQGTRMDDYAKIGHPKHNPKRVSLWNPLL